MSAPGEGLSGELETAPDAPVVDSGRRTPPPATPGRDVLPRTPTQSWGGTPCMYMTPLRTGTESRWSDGSNRRTAYFSASQTPKRQTPMADRFIPDRSSGLSMAERYEMHQSSRKRRKPEEDDDEEEDDSHAELKQALVTSGRLVPSGYKPTRLFAPSAFGSPTGKFAPRDELGSLVLGAKPYGNQPHAIFLQPPKAQRTFSKSAFKVLDAPGLRTDFYSHLVDWGPGRPTAGESLLAVGLQSTVHLWSAASARVITLCDLGPADLVTSISWMEGGTHLALGTASGSVQIWDVNCQRRVRKMSGHILRVGCLAWNNCLLTTGSRDRTILQRDVRESRHFTMQLTRHHGEVCGLKWGSGMLASGGNDDRLIVWDERQTQRPLWRIRAHSSAIRAIDWSPHQANILATGGGRSDRHVKTWNVQTRKLLASRDTKSQVCDLVWSKNTNEIVSVHGFNSNQVVLWKASKLQQIATLAGHDDKVLYLSLSPDGEMIVTGSGDETLRLWQVFPAARPPKREESITGAPSMIR